MQGDAAFRYWAFLSYSHADETFARKLHLALERYALPRRLRKAHTLPRRLIPVFRDVEELEAASGLTSRLQEALDQSRWLIVLCSPAAAKSKYVNAEIEYFIGKHGARRVLCALVEGEPADSFPPAIKALKDEPLAADFRPGRDFELARLKLIAAMAVVGFTELRNREAQRRRRQQIAVAAFAAGVAIGAIGYWDLFYRTHVGYYVNYVRRNGIWEGIDRISPSVAAHRTQMYRFTRHGRLNPPDRVDFINASGTCPGDGMETILGESVAFDIYMRARRYCSAAFDYARDGHLERESVLNERGKPKMTMAYTGTGLAQLTQEGFALPSEGSGVNYVQFKRDDAGFDTEVRFLYARDMPRANQHNQYGFAFERDGQGRLLARRELDDQGHPTGETRRFVYAATGDWSEMRFEDAHGRPQLSSGGYAVERHVLDDSGNAIRETYLSPDGTPTPSSFRYASRTIALDARGNATERCYFDELDKPIGSGDSGTECDRYRYDDRGRIVWAGAFDQHGKPSKGNAGYTHSIFIYDESGSVVESRNLDESGNLAEGSFGTARERVTYDARGNIVDEFFFGADGKPAHSNYGAGIHHSLDIRDQFLEFSFFDGDGKPFTRPDAGYAQAHFKRDERGNIVEAMFLGTDLKPVVTKRFGLAFRQVRRDDTGNPVEQRALDPQRRPMKDVNQVALYRREFNALGQQTLETYFDEQERPTLHKDGYYGVRTEHDHHGRESQRVYLDPQRRPVFVARLGGAGVRYEYDVLGRLKQEIYLDTSGAPLTTGAVQRMEYERDKYGEELARRYYGPGNVLTASPTSGCAIESRAFDALGHLTMEQCLDSREHLRNRNGDGWAQKTTSWDHGRMTEERYLDASGQPVKPPT